MTEMTMTTTATTATALNDRSNKSDELDNATQLINKSVNSVWGVVEKTWRNTYTYIHTKRCSYFAATRKQQLK